MITFKEYIAGKYFGGDMTQILVMLIYPKRFNIDLVREEIIFEKLKQVNFPMLSSSHESEE